MFLDPAQVLNAEVADEKNAELKGELSFFSAGPQRSLRSFPCEDSGKRLFQLQKKTKGTKVIFFFVSFAYFVVVNFFQYYPDLVSDDPGNQDV